TCRASRSIWSAEWCSASRRFRPRSWARPSARRRRSCLHGRFCATHSSGAARPAWRAALAAINAEGWRLVALTRIAAPLPGGAINYLYGLTGIGLVPYVTATAVGLIPPVTLFAGAGALGRFALAEAERSIGRGV